MAEQKRVMISSTARDLPEHRKETMDACLRQGMFPIMMEHLPASDDEAISASLKMVDEADIYVLILAHRYGYIPKVNNPEQISVTEHEYNRAIERKIPILTFGMHADHPIKAADVETGEGATKLKAFKERALLKVTNFFKSPADLRAHIIDSLSDRRERDVSSFHYIAEAPSPPEPYIAHPYTLLQTHTLIGRQKELQLLTDWIAGKELEFDRQKAPPSSVRILSVVAIGGMGKSALTWKWFEDVAPQEMKNLAGRMWWSFYESDATFENFVTRALAYVSTRALDEVQQIPASTREAQLLAALDHQPFFLVLDGLERTLIAYARMDAARLDDSEVGKEKSLRKTADPRMSSFLKKLVQVNQSRVLVSSRLYPAELETSGGDAIPGTLRLNIEGLADEDAVELWRAFGISGSRDELLPVFNTFGKHPLIIQALAGEVKRYRKAPGNFGSWRKANPKFDPGRFSKTKEAMAHVLEFALHGLGDKSRHVLQTISAFRMPATYDTLTALLVGKSKMRYESSTNRLLSDPGRLFEEETDLDAALTDLEDRGLVGWDKRANRYDSHPIVRAVVWYDLGNNARRGVYTSLQAHFEALPTFHKDVNNLEDLTPAIELYNTLVILGRYDRAFSVFRERLSDNMLNRLSTNLERLELLEMLFPDGLNNLPRLNGDRAQISALHSLALGYQFCGQPGRAGPVFRRVKDIYSKSSLDFDYPSIWGNLANSLRVSGALTESELSARIAIVASRQRSDYSGEAFGLMWLGWLLAARAIPIQAEEALARALKMYIAQVDIRYSFESIATSFLAQRSLWLGETARASTLVTRSWDLAQVHSYERDFIRAARMQGEVAMASKNFPLADDRLHHALLRARRVNFVEEELTSLVALADLRRQQNELKGARDLLTEIWELADRGPYPLFHADALNVTAHIECDEGNSDAAIEAATKAYKLAWCDGPPFAYHWGLEKAKQHLKELGVPEPEMPPFDESKFEPMPEVEINPHDEFHVDESELEP